MRSLRLAATLVLLIQGGCITYGSYKDLTRTTFHVEPGPDTIETFVGASVAKVEGTKSVVLEAVFHGGVHRFLAAPLKEDPPWGQFVTVPLDTLPGERIALQVNDAPPVPNEPPTYGSWQPDDEDAYRRGTATCSFVDIPSSQWDVRVRVSQGYVATYIGKKMVIADSNTSGKVKFALLCPFTVLLDAALSPFEGIAILITGWDFWWRPWFGWNIS
jgi:hypothetical protein